jgi:hypothetical protein
MDEYIKIREAIADCYPDLIGDFDAKGFENRLTIRMGEWLDANLPIKDGWGTQLILETAGMIRNLEAYQ